MTTDPFALARTTAASTAITCPVCGRTSYNPNDREQGWCGHCNAVTAPPGIHPDIVTIRVAAQRARSVAGLDTDEVADFVRSFAELLDICSQGSNRVGTVGHVHVHAAALQFLATTRHLETA